MPAHFEEGWVSWFSLLVESGQLAGVAESIFARLPLPHVHPCALALPRLEERTSIVVVVMKSVVGGAGLAEGAEE